MEKMLEGAMMKAHVYERYLSMSFEWRYVCYKHLLSKTQTSVLMREEYDQAERERNKYHWLSKCIGLVCLAPVLPSLPC